MQIVPRKYAFFLNKYTIVVYAFIIWMLFFDRHNVRAQYELHQTIENMSIQKLDYEEKIKETAQRRATLDRDRERFAREKYLMHRPDEDVFIIAEPK